MRILFFSLKGKLFLFFYMLNPFSYDVQIQGCFSFQELLFVAAVSSSCPETSMRVAGCDYPVCFNSQEEWSLFPSTLQKSGVMVQAGRTSSFRLPCGCSGSDVIILPVPLIFSMFKLSPLILETLLNPVPKHHIDFPPWSSSYISSGLGKNEGAAAVPALVWVRMRPCLWNSRPFLFLFF